MRILPIILFAFCVASLAGLTLYFEYHRVANEQSQGANRSLEKPTEVRPAGASNEEDAQKIKLYMSIGVTIFVLAACLYVMLASRYAPKSIGLMPRLEP